MNLPVLQAEASQAFLFCDPILSNKFLCDHARYLYLIILDTFMLLKLKINCHNKFQINFLFMTKPCKSIQSTRPAIKSIVIALNISLNVFCTVTVIVTL